MGHNSVGISNQISYYRCTCIGNGIMLIIHVSNNGESNKLSYGMLYLTEDQIFPEVLY